MIFEVEAKDSDLPFRELTLNLIKSAWKFINNIALYDGSTPLRVDVDRDTVTESAVFQESGFRDLTLRLPKI